MKTCIDQTLAVTKEKSVKEIVPLKIIPSPFVW